jgi:hypothetical protein
VHGIHFDTDRATDASRRRTVHLCRPSAGEREGPSEPSEPPVAPGTHAARPDGSSDDSSHSHPEPSAANDASGWGSDAPDDPDDSSPDVEPMTAAEFAAFMDLH